MTDNIDNVKAFLKRNETDLAELRIKTLGKIKEIRDKIVEDGVAIGISPDDNMLKNNRTKVTEIIFNMFKKFRVKTEGRMIPPPLSITLIGEYSNSHRWHYHGIIKVTDIIILDKIKRMIKRRVGRCVTEQIRNVPLYIDYMFKQYNNPQSFYPFTSSCYLQIDRP